MINQNTINSARKIYISGPVWYTKQNSHITTCCDTW